MTSGFSDLREEISSIIQTTLNEAESRWQAKLDACHAELSRLQAKQDAHEAAPSRLLAKHEAARWHAELKAMVASLSAHIAKRPTGTSSMAAPNPDSSNEVVSSDPGEEIGPYELRKKKRKRGAPSNYDYLKSPEYVPSSPPGYVHLKFLEDVPAESFPPYSKM